MWLPLTKVNKAAEIQGEILIEIEKIRDVVRQENTLRVTVMEARDLAPKDMFGSSDPFVTVSFLEQSKTTSTQKKTRFPSWYETFEFNMPLSCPPKTVIEVKLWDWDRVSSNDFLGEVNINFRNLPDGCKVKKWYRLMPRPPHMENRSAGGDPMFPKPAPNRGSVRIKVHLIQETVLPTYSYGTLRHILTDSVLPKGTEAPDLSAVHLLEEISRLDLNEMSNCLVRLYLNEGLITEYLTAITAEEVKNTSDPNTLFRGNSLATKSMDHFMKVVGLHYLQETMGHVIDQVYGDRRIVELDPTRVDSIKRRHWSSIKESNGHVLEHSKTAVTCYITNIMEAILNSHSKCPILMRLVFKHLKEQVQNKWPTGNEENMDYAYHAVSGFLFLRFFVPAILSPKLFLLQEHHPDRKVSRTLTLLAKVTQTIGNLSEPVGKEQWLQPLHDFVREKIDDVRTFIDTLTDISTDNTLRYFPNRQPFYSGVILKEGYLHKCRYSSKKLLNRLSFSFSFKPQYFWLTYKELRYSPLPESKVQSVKLTDQICAVERLDYSAFGKDNIGQLISQTPDNELEILYFQAKDINDLYSWLSAIRKTFSANKQQLKTYHPGIYRRNRWSCCHRIDTDAVGCSPTHNKVTLQEWMDPIDCDMEAQTVCSQLIARQTQLQHIIQDTEEKAPQVGKQASNRQGAGPAPRKLNKNMAKQLLEISEQLHLMQQAIDEPSKDPK
ncbi:rasGAP-activating-like protein 1 isoform X3 [Octopus sinensis]|nr:rasGAP-activating-like protein 1 isoform X3 [Octopus sinensis]